MDIVEYIKLRWALGAVAAFCVSMWIGGKETYRCVRTVFGPTEVTYTEATQKGLNGYGYIKLTGIEPRIDDAIGVMGKDGGTLKAMYMGVEPGPGEQVSGQSRVVLCLAGSPTNAEAQALAGATEARGFVDTTIPYHTSDVPKDQLRSLARSSAEDGWVLEVRRPSWKKAGLCLGVPLLAAAGLFLYLKNKPLEG